MKIDSDFVENETSETRQDEQFDVSSNVIAAIQGYEADIQQAEEVKQDALQSAEEAMRAGRLEDAESALKTAGEADQAVTYMRLVELEQESQLSTVEGADSEGDQQTSKSSETPEDRTHINDNLATVRPSPEGPEHPLYKEMDGSTITDTTNYSLGEPGEGSLEPPEGSRQGGIEGGE